MKVESVIEKLLEDFLENYELDLNLPRLHRPQVIDFVKQGLSRLSQSYEVIIHSFKLHDELFAISQNNNLVLVFGCQQNMGLLLESSLTRTFRSTHTR